VLFGRPGWNDDGVMTFEKRFDFRVGHLAEEDSCWFHGDTFYAVDACCENRLENQTQTVFTKVFKQVVDGARRGTGQGVACDAAVSST
jgi:hypothetical protein